MTAAESTNAALASKRAALAAWDVAVTEWRRAQMLMPNLEFSAVMTWRELAQSAGLPDVTTPAFVADGD